MKRKITIITIIALLLLMTLAACGGDKKAASDKPAAQTSSETKTESEAKPAAKSEEKATPVPPTATPAPPTATPVPPTATPEPEEELSGEFANIQSVVDSYRSEGEVSYDVSITPANGQEETHLHMTFSNAWTKAENDFGCNYATTVEGLDMMADSGETDENIPDAMYVVAIDDLSYLKFGDDWMSMPRDASGEDMMMDMGIEDFAEDVDNLKKIGTEKINGIKTIHYQYKDEEAFNDMLNSILESQLNDNQSVAQYEAIETKTRGDIWIAKKGKYAVKMEIYVETTFKSKVDDSTISIKGVTRNEVTEVNKKIVIEAPEDAPKANEVNMPGFAPGEFPVPDKTIVASMLEGMATLTSELSVEEVTAFFDKELADLGWTKEEGPMPTWNKGEHSIMLMISPGETEGTTTTLVMTNQ
jgi:hypothetical protein